MNIEITVDVYKLHEDLKSISESFPILYDVVADEVFKQLISCTPDYHDTFPDTLRRGVS